MAKRGKISQNRLGTKGQFYLVAAIILTVVIVAVIAVSNSSASAQNTEISSLKDQINIEARNVLDNAIYNHLSQPDLNLRMQNFTQNYINAERDKSLYFIFGEPNNITLKGFQKSQHNVFLNDFSVTSSSGAFFYSTAPATNKINLRIDNNLYSFGIKDGENFYFVVSQESGGTNYVISG